MKRSLMSLHHRVALGAMALSALLMAALPARVGAEGRVVFEQNFEKVPKGELPPEFLTLNGVFAVVEEQGSKLVELPGSPLEDFGFLFGPSEASGQECSARIFGTKQGRKFPTFAVGVNGGGGYKIRVAPAKKAIELLKGDDVSKSAAFEWRSGEWTHLKLRVRKTGDGVTVEAKAWQGDKEPEEWALSLNEKEPLPPGKSGVWGMPYAGTPIRFDDLRVQSISP